MARPGRDEKGLFLPGNQLSVGNNGNKEHAFYPTPESLQQEVDAYFAHCETPRADDDPKPTEFPNILGFIAFSQLSGRASLQDYKNRNSEFSYIIKRLHARCYAAKAQLAMEGKINPTIFIFDAVNNHGFINTRSDNRNQTDHTGKVQVEAVSDPEFTDIVGKYIDKDDQPVIEHNPQEQKPEGVPPVGE